MKTIITREVTARIVQDLARATRTVSAIAGRYDVPVESVEKIRERYGPEIPQLIAAAEELRRPERPQNPVTASAVAPSDLSTEVQEPAPDAVTGPEPQLAVDDRRGADGLTRLERDELRAWASATGREVSAAGRIAAVLVQEWEQEGRPIVAADGVVDAGIVDLPVTEETAALMLREQFFEAMNALVDVLPWASVHLRDVVQGFILQVAAVTDTIESHRVEHDMVEAAAQTLFQLAQQGLLPADVAKLRDAARVVLAAVEVVPA